MQAGDLVRCPPLNNRHGYHINSRHAERPLGVLLIVTVQGCQHSSLVWVKGKKLVFLTGELEVVDESR